MDENFIAPALRIEGLPEEPVEPPAAEPPVVKEFLLKAAVFFGVIVFLFSSLLGGWLAWSGETLVVKDQKHAEAVIVTKAVLFKDGFIVLRKKDLTRISTPLFLPAGLYDNISIGLDVEPEWKPATGETIEVVLYKDTDGDAAFGRADAIVKDLFGRQIIRPVRLLPNWRLPPS